MHYLMHDLMHDLMRSLLAVLTCVLAMPSLAAETPWQEIAPGARMRLVTSDTLAAGNTTLAGIELDMPARMKTYWRVPGETGIPTELDLAGSVGVASHGVLWPYPTIDTRDGYHDFSYYGPLVLPVELTLADASGRLQVAVTLGICEEICVPASARFELPLDFARPDAGNALRLRQAVSMAPLPWDGAAFGEIAFDPEARTLSVVLPSEEIASQSVIADIAGTAALFGAPQKSPDTNLVVLPLLGGGDPVAGAGVTLTFNTPRGPFHVEKPLGVRSTGS